MTSPRRLSTSDSASDISRARIRSIRCGLVGSNGRMTTRLLVGLSTMPVRLIFGRTRLLWYPLGDDCHVSSIHLHLAEGRQSAFQQFHFGQRKQEGQGRLGSLVHVYAVFLKTVVASSGLGVVDVEAQVVAAQEPLERKPRFLEPDRVFGGMVSLDARGHRGMALDGLLIELGAFPAAVVKAIAADRAEAAGRRLLLLDQPRERLQPQRQAR